MASPAIPQSNGTLGKIYDWVDERAGISEIMHELLDEPIPGGTKYAYAFGSALLFIFALQSITGVFLAMYYVPSAEDAHKSVEYIMKEVPFGAFMRGMHHYGSSAMVIMVVLHILQIVIWGAYKQKRELLWLVGAGLLQLVLAFSLSGYLLPWDMKAYYGTVVTVGIASEVPIFGDMIKRIIIGGTEMGTITISRFFMVHVFLLPALMAGGIAAHLYLFRKAQPAGPFNMTEQEAMFKVEPFWPGQVFKDAVFSLVVFVILAYLSWTTLAPLEPKADPSQTQYIARPEWYFLFLFQLLKYFPGSTAIIGSLIIPGLVMAIITFLPFLDRDPERHPLKRPFVMLGTVGLLIAMLTLHLLAKRDDAQNFAAQLKAQEEEGERFLREPFEPKDTSQKAAVLAAPAPEAFVKNCAVCHGEQGEGGPAGPKLIGVAKKPGRSKEEIVGLIENPSSYGASGMPPMPQVSATDRAAIADWILLLK
ncbi:MAG: cytochrome b N-terminal domain-containing protein [Acidobacteriota bacterium]